MMFRANLVRCFVTAASCLIATFCGAATLVPAGANWKYKDNGSNQGTAWRTTTFDDSMWASGPAELGYGDAPVTTIDDGPDTNRYITSYFRHVFFANDVTNITALTLNLQRDDGAAVYLNGTEVVRTNLATGATYLTAATLAVSGTDETTYFPFSISPSLLREGANLLAVEVHQSDPTSSDVSFDLSLISDVSAGVSRGPYLNTLTSNTVTVRWRSDVATNSRVRYGTSFSALNSTADNPTNTTEHVVQLSGLTPATRYYYMVGSTVSSAASNDLAPYFETAPVAGADVPVRIWALGDFGNGSSGQRRVYDQYRMLTGSTYTDVWLWLGDNAYNSGTDSEHQQFIFNYYPDLLRTTAFWPTLGNHDSVNANSITQSGPYYDICTLPKNAEAGGVPSGTEAYYSFDYGPIHFICLDTDDTLVDPSNPAMLQWVEDDIGQTTQNWIIAFFHHPPYTKGSHDSDKPISGPIDSAGRMVDAREKILPILEAGGVDVVLSGHSHNYERSYLLNNHYQNSSTFTPEMKLDAGSGREDQSGAYAKPELGPHANKGAVYVVAGSGGQTPAATALNHPAHYASLNMFGSVILELNGKRLDATFLDDTGVAQDYFTLTKGEVPTTGPLVHSFTARTMLPQQETVAPTGTTAQTSGTVSATVNTETRELNYKITWSGLTGAVTGLTINGPAAVKNDGPVVLNVNPSQTGTAGTAVGVATLTAAQVDDTTAGLLYCNLLTATNPAGEIRGQLIVDTAARKTVTFTGNPLTDFGAEYRRQSSRAAIQYYTTWDDTNLYVAVNGDAAYAKTEPTILYIDTDPIQGSRAGTSGSATPQVYDNRSPGLPFTGNVVAYFKSGYAEVRMNTNGTWSSATDLTTNLNVAGANSIELAIPWTAFPAGLRPSTFHYVIMKDSASAGGTSGYAFYPSVAAITDVISNINTAGLRRYAVAQLATPFVSAGSANTLKYNSGLTVDFANTGAKGGRVRHTRFLSGPTGNSFAGSAISPGGASITPSHVAADRYWTAKYDGNGGAGLQYTMSLDTTGTPDILDADRLVIVKREGAGDPWSPSATSRNGNILSSSGFTGFSDFTFGSDSAQLPVTMTDLSMD